MRTRFSLAAGAVLISMLWSCGGTDTPSSPSTPGASQATIAISPAGVAPTSVTITSGNRVTFVNNDSVAHNMASDPHPTHGDCPSLSVGSIAPGQSRETGNLTTRRSCGFHDHDAPDNAALKGTVTVQ